MKPDKSAFALDKKKADALIDSVREDRSKFFKFQAGKDKDTMRSGKDW
ncbi:MAG: hypothetical protein ABIK92_18960 [Pseudomonadota bacterium]